MRILTGGKTEEEKAAEPLATTTVTKTYVPSTYRAGVSVTDIEVVQGRKGVIQQVVTPEKPEITELQVQRAMAEASRKTVTETKKRKRRIQEIEGKVERGEQLSITDYAYLGILYPEQVAVVHETAEGVKASKKFYGAIGYPQYGGMYAPFTVPEGYKVREIKETEGGLDVLFGPIYTKPKPSKAWYEEYKAKRGLAPATGELYSLIAPTLISIRAGQQPRLSDILYGMEQPKGLLADITFVSPEKKLGVPERVVKAQPIHFFGGMVESVESVGELLFPYPVPVPERPLSAERIFGIIAGSLVMGEVAAKVFQPVTVEIQRKAGTWLTEKYLKSMEAGKLWQPGLKEKAVMKILGVQPHVAKQVLLPPSHISKMSLEGLKATEMAWMLETTPRTSAVTVGKGVVETTTHVSMPHLFFRGGVLTVGFLQEPLGFKTIHYQEPFPAELKEWIMQKPVYGVMPHIPVVATGKAGEMAIPLLGSSLLGIQTAKVTKEVERSTGKISMVDLTPKVPSVKPEIIKFPTEKVLPKILGLETVKPKEKPAVAPFPRLVPSVIPKLGLEQFLAEKPKALVEPFPLITPDITRIKEKVKRQEGVMALPEPLPKLAALGKIAPFLPKKPLIPQLITPKGAKPREPQFQTPTPKLELEAPPKLKTPMSLFPKLTLPQIPAQIQMSQQQLAFPKPPTLTVPTPATPKALPPFWLPRGGEPEAGTGRGLWGAWFKREHQIKTPEAMLKAFGLKTPRRRTLGKKSVKRKLQTSRRKRGERFWF